MPVYPSSLVPQRGGGIELRGAGTWRRDNLECTSPHELERLPFSGGWVGPGLRCLPPVSSTTLLLRDDITCRQLSHHPIEPRFHSSVNASRYATLLPHSSKIPNRKSSITNSKSLFSSLDDTSWADVDVTWLWPRETR
jgi:hypothetical protein